MLKFWKTQTIGNDFVLLRAEDVVGHDIQELAKNLCRRNFSVGSDGLLVVARQDYGLSLQMFNPDGTEDFCGNGLRCAGDHALREGWEDAGFRILHGGQMIPTQIASDGSVSITLPPASFRPEDIPALSLGEVCEETVHGVIGTAVSTGSAHFVALVDQLPEDEAFFKWSPLIELDPLFPEHISVMYCKQTGPANLRLRIWERSVGETLGCGTGSVASAIVWARKQNFSGEVTVQNPGGDLRVQFEHWSGPVTSVSSPKRTFEGFAEVKVGLPSGRASLA